MLTHKYTSKDFGKRTNSDSKKMSVRLNKGQTIYVISARVAGLTSR